MALEQAPRLTPPRLHFQLPVEPSHLLRARGRIRDYLEQHCSENQLIDDVVLCIEEAATNAIRHSGSSKPIEIDLEFEGDDLIARVKDEGRGFDIEAFDPDRQPDLLSVGGRGLFLISRLADEMELQHNDGLEVRMVRKAVELCEASATESGLGDARASSRVAARETRLRAMLEEIDEGFLAVDWEYRIVHVNEVALRLTGTSRSGLLDGRPWEVLSIMAGPAPQQACRDAMELGRPARLEHCAAVSGDWFEVRIYPTPAGISVYFSEINERKRIEEELLSSRERLASTLAAISDGFYTVDRQWRVTYCNDKAAAFMRRSKEEVLGRNYLELFPGLAGTEFGINERAAMELGEFRSFEAYFAPHDAWYEERDYPSADGITVIFADITERKRAEKEREELFSSRERLATALGTVTDGFYTLDRTWRVTYCNDKAAAFIQRSKQQVLGRSYFELFPGILGTEFEANKRAAMEQGEFRAYEAYYMPHDAWYEERDYPSAEGITVLFTDISERKQAEEEHQRLLEESQAQAEELQAQSEELQAQSEELQAQSEELQAQSEELRAAMDALAARTHLAETLNAINRRVHSTLASEAILQAALDEGVRALAVDAADVNMREGSAWVTRYHCGFSADDLGVRLSDAEAPVSTLAMGRMESLAISDVPADPALNSGFARKHGLRSMLAVPLIVRRAVVGCLFFYGKRARVFSEADIDFAHKLGATVSLALDNARLYEAQRRIATTLQENLIHPLPSIEGLELGRVAETASAPELVGGDFSSVFAIDESHVAILIGDVAGKGISAAGLTETVHSAVSSFALIDPAPAFILRKTNELLLRRGGPNGFVTAFLLIIDLCSGEAAYASAGHPAPVVVNGSSSRVLEVPSGLPLGILESEYVTGLTTLRSDDCAVLYTDGVTEARRGTELFGDERLEETLAALGGSHPQVVAEELGGAATRFAGTLKDDLQILAFRLGGRRSQSSDRLTALTV